MDQETGSIIIYENNENDNVIMWIGYVSQFFMHIIYYYYYYFVQEQLDIYGKADTQENRKSCIINLFKNIRMIWFSNFKNLYMSEPGSKAKENVINLLNFCCLVRIGIRSWERKNEDLSRSGFATLLWYFRVLKQPSNISVSKI